MTMIFPAGRSRHERKTLTSISGKKIQQKGIML